MAQKKRGRGRPRLGKKARVATNISLDPDLKRRAIKKAGERGLSQWIEGLIRKGLGKD